MVIRSVGTDLILTGGRPRGTLYAVFRFLEEYVGVHWWTPFEEEVPHRPTLKLPALDDAGEPAFAYREPHPIDGPRKFCARNRLNGHFTALSAAYGGSFGYGPPFHCHTFNLYFPPVEYFATHPEFYAEVGGLRYADGQLCLTNEDLLERAAEKLEAYIAEGRRLAEALGQPPPRVYAFSANDWRAPCGCDACSAVVEREGSQSGPLLQFVNRLADRIRRTHPEVLLETLAYDYTFDPPADLGARDNVIVRVSALFHRDYSKPLSHPRNRRYLTALEGWSARAAHLRVWDYIVTYGPDGDLPLPNVSFLAQDLRTYLELGVEGVFVSHGRYSVDLRDLKLWLLAKLLEDPHRDERKLLRTFTDGYYGPAGKHIRRYLALRGKAVERRDCSFGFQPTAEEFCYLDLKFVASAQRLFDRAWQRVAARPTLARRVRHARLTLDRAAIHR